MHYVSYWGRFSGVVEKDLKNIKTSIRDVQAVLLNLFSADTVLIGHSFEHTLYALKVKKYRSVLLQNRMCWDGSPYHYSYWLLICPIKMKRIAVHVDNIVQLL